MNENIRKGIAEEIINQVDYCEEIIESSISKYIAAQVENKNIGLRLTSEGIGYKCSQETWLDFDELYIFTPVSEMVTKLIDHCGGDHDYLQRVVDDLDKSRLEIKKHMTASK